MLCNNCCNTDRGGTPKDVKQSGPVAVLHRCIDGDNCRSYMSLTNNNLPRNGNNRFYSPAIIIDVTGTKKKKKEREGPHAEAA